MRFKRFLFLLVFVFWSVATPSLAAANSRAELCVKGSESAISPAEFLVLALEKIGLSGSSGRTRFTDIPAGSWYESAVRLVDEAGALTEFRENFQPKRDLLRGEAVSLALKIFGIGVPLVPPPEDFLFSDLRRSHRLRRTIYSALQLGAISPISESEFGVAKPLTCGDANILLENLKKPTSTASIIINSSSLPKQNYLEAIYSEITEKFLFSNQVNSEKIAEGAMAGMVNSLGDPYSQYFSPSEAKSFFEGLDGEFEGIGAYLSQKKTGEIVVISPIRGSPADQAGIRAGDQIIGVAGKSILGESLNEVVKKIRGPRGSNVEIEVLRNNKEIKIIVTRNLITLKSVELKFENNVAILHLTQFGTETPAEFAKAAAEIISKSPRKVILDLRDNGGGLLTGASEIAGYFLPKGSLVATSEFRSDRSYLNEKYVTEREPILARFPTVVLVNRGSASASEIVAAALQDYGFAVVAGEKTFGKGTMQEISFLRDGSAVKITIAHWLSPKKQVIEGNGVTPNVGYKDIVDNPDTTPDEALNQLIYN